MDKKKVAAAIGGVMEYLRAEQEQLLAAARAPAPMPQPNLWGMSGRSSAMDMRMLMQLRAFKGTR